MRKIKAIGLISGGLDSILALKIMVDQGFEVIAFNMKSPFCTCDSQGKCYSQLVAEKFGVPIRRIYVGDDYLKIVKNPQHGYGKNMNPCIDCRIFLFNKAREIMQEAGADFVFTGEVLGERPMSQRKEAMNLIERESGLKGRVLRPLSAKLLEPTLMEKEGKVDRNILMDIQGRSRKPQINLARKYQINDYPTPAGGCLLTDENFTRKVKDSFEHGEDSLRHMSLLKAGRHFRLPDGTKIIAGRDQKENETLMALSLPSELKFTVHGYKSTYVLILGKPSLENQTWAARICAKYCDRDNSSTLPVRVWLDSTSLFNLIEAEPLDELSLSSIRIGG
jgi:tRNA-specific 2-thiouridylase